MNGNDSSRNGGAGGVPAPGGKANKTGVTGFALPVFCLLLVFHSLTASAALQASLDRDRVASGESVQLTLLRDGRGDSQPDLAPLQQDFEVLGQASGSRVEIVNGRMNAQAQLRLTLMPRREGRLRVPELTWAGERSPALTLEVGGRGGGGDKAAPSTHVFITSTLAKPPHWLQAAIPLKLRLYTDQPLLQASLSFSGSGDAQVRQIGQDRQYGETRDGRRYQVIERDYLVFPQRSGRVSLAGPVLDAQVLDARAGDPFAGAFPTPFGNPFAGMMGGTRPLRVRGDAIVLDVRPRPAEATGKDWLPARALRLEESWRPETGAIRAGEPLTRHLRLTALGLDAARLPDLSARMVLPEGLKRYPDQPRLNDQVKEDTIEGSREQDVAFIASRPGRYTLPALRLNWWDTEAARAREVVLPERTLEVLPALATAGAAADAPTAAASAPALPGPVATDAGFPWGWLSLALGLLWLATLAAWWWTRRAHPRSQAPLVADRVARVDPIAYGAARKAFRQACRDHDALAARRHLLDWARANWPQDPPLGLNALARRLPDARQRGLLRELDRACYAGGDWNSAQLVDALTTLPGAVARPGAKPERLAGLYP